MLQEDTEDKMFRTLIECTDLFNNAVPVGLRGKVSEYQRYFRNLRLLFAADRKDLCIQRMETLINEGADINAVDSFNNSVLHHVVKNPKVTFEIIKFLLESGADPDIRNSINKPPLAYCKELPSAKLLIQYTVMSKMYLNDFCTNFDSKRKIKLKRRKAEKFLDLSFCKSIYLCTVFTHSRDTCIVEMTMMKEDKIAEGYTFFDFIADNFLKSERLPEDKEIGVSAIVEIVLRLCNNKYPFCRDIINAAIRLSNIDLTTSLFDLKIYAVKPSVVNSSEKAIILNSECTTEIGNYLTQQDTINLIIAFRHSSILKSKLYSSKRMREEGEPSYAKQWKFIKN